MADLFRGKYRIPSARCPNWDYCSNGAYFITICTDKRIHFFGSIKNQITTLTEAGQIAENLWAEIPSHFAFIQLDAFVIMPNHIHGILIINIKDRQGGSKKIKNILKHNQPVELLKSKDTTELMSLISPKTGSVASVIRSYKSACSNQINKRIPGLNFKWQARFHDHIIRDRQSFCRIRQYILNNPSKWNDDIFHR